MLEEAGEKRAASLDSVLRVPASPSLEVFLQRCVNAASRCPSIEGIRREAKPEGTPPVSAEFRSTRATVD